MKPFFENLEALARERQSLLCVGLDPHPELLSEDTAQAACRFCLDLIAATADQALAFKPNSAFFEAYGAAGFEAMREVIGAVPAGIPVILDGKRGDIASTARAYARAAFQTLGVHAVTLNPYLGRDAVEPFLGDPARGVFLLCKTSNPGADGIQRATTAGGEPLFLALAREAEHWSPHDNLGLVVGATDTQALRAARAATPDLWFLSPGVGAQGGDLSDALAAGLRPDGLGMVVPVSRGIAAQPDPRAAAIRLREAIEAHRAEVRPPGGLSAGLAPLADALLEAGCVRFGDFTLKSGQQSPIYIDLRLLASLPDLLAQVAAAYLPVLKALRFDRLAALPYAALPIGTAIALQSGRPLIYPRRETKAYGTRAAVEGQFQAGETAVVVDDLATTGGSKLEAIERLKAEGLEVRDVVVLIDRQGGAQEALAAVGCGLHAVFTLGALLDHWQSRGALDPAQAQRVRDFLARSQRK